MLAHQQLGHLCLFHSTFKIKLADNMTLGSDFDVHARIINNTMEAKVFSFMLFAFTVSYDGKRGEPCGITSEKVELKIGEGKLIT